MIETEESIPVSVLVVDDNQEMLNALKAALGGMDLNIITAQSGQNALIMLQMQDFAMVLLDVNMPDMDGYETAEKIHQCPRSEHMPILFITAQSPSDEARLKGYKLGAVDYIFTPILPQILRAKVQVFADLHRLREQVRRHAEKLLEKNKEIAHQNIILKKNNLLLNKTTIQLAEKEKITCALNQDLDEFSYSIAHDLKGPLRAIDGFSKILVQKYNNALDMEAKRMLTVITDNVSKMAILIENLLMFAHLGRQTITIKFTKMRDFVDEIVKEVLEQVLERKIVIDVKELPDNNVNQPLMHQVWTNLIWNAIKFTQTKKKALIEIGGYTENDTATYYIKDNGLGFDMNHVGKLFNVFQRLHGAEIEGTGIGLASVKKIISRHNGKVWAKGKVGKGATFYFTLPMSSNKESENSQ
jgi:two-component system sensor histidine kinase/response regulator